LIASAIFYAAVSLRPPDDTTCTRLLFPASEGLEAVRYRWENFRDYFVPPSVYRGPPAAEREKAWDDLAPCKFKFLPQYSRFCCGFAN